jgi:hypothetical protein
MAPRPHGAQQAPERGDVYFDGLRLGRWIGDHLEREAGRPQCAGTGFDPRLSPAWPGTLQGSWSWGG